MDVSKSFIYDILYSKKPIEFITDSGKFIGIPLSHDEDGFIQLEMIKSDTQLLTEKKSPKDRKIKIINLRKVVAFYPYE